jgi:hypothetical protein
MGVLARRIRQTLAVLLPGAIWFWGELYVSGYTRYPDGSRDIGHMEKILNPVSITVFLLVLGAPTLGAGLIALAIARGRRRLTRAPAQTRPQTDYPFLADALALGILAGAAIAVLVWLASLYAWGIAHPCAGCFG